MELLSEDRLDNMILYSEQRLQYLAHDQIWKGKGTESDPFVIENANILGQAILIKKSSLYISFINCNFDHAQFEACKNILLKDCTFETLSLSKSMKFKIYNCYISDLKFSRTKEIVIKKTVIFDVPTKFRIKNIIFEDCQINNEFLDYVLRKKLGGFYSKIKEIIVSFIIIIILFIFYRLFWATYALNYSDVKSLFLIVSVIIVLLIILCFSSFYEYLAKRKVPKIIISESKKI